MISPVKVWRRQKHIRANLGKQGRIITWTKIVIAGSAFKTYAPYPVVLVEFEKGNKMYGQLVDYKERDLKIGKKVISILRRIRQPTEEGIIAYGIKFKPMQ